MMTMRFGLLALASTLMPSGAQAATLITTTGSNYADHATFDVAKPPFAVPTDRNGTLYITGMGTNVARVPGEGYSEAVRLQGSGSFAGFTGEGLFEAKNDDPFGGNSPSFLVTLTSEGFTYRIELSGAKGVATHYSYDQVFSEDAKPTDATLAGQSFMNEEGDGRLALPFVSIKWFVTQNSTGSGYSAGIYGPAAVGINIFEIASNDAIVASTVTAPVPEPATWAMMLIGFGLIGAARRYRCSTALMA